MFQKTIIHLLQVLGLLFIIFILFMIYTSQKILGMNAHHFFWFVMIPVMVLTIYLSPGLWRNVCPLATTNLAYYNLVHKRKIEKYGKEVNNLSGLKGKLYEFLRKRGAIISAILFWTIVPLRLIFFHSNAMSTFLIIISLFIFAFIMGILFPVKSGWCTSICPMFAVEKAYGINPAFKVKNIRCEYKQQKTGQIFPCSGCSFNCIDVNGYERSHIMEGMSKFHHDNANAFMRKLFISTLPGFITGYMMIAFKMAPYTLIPLPHPVAVYLLIIFSMIISYLVYEIAKSLFRKTISHEEGELTIEKPNPHYGIMKRRLDLICVAYSVSFIWISFSMRTLLNLTTNYVGESYAVPAMWISMVFILIVSLLFIFKGWNDSLSTQETSWF